MEKLVQTLTAMINTHSRLLDLAKEKRTILVDGRVDGLQSLVIKENSCVNEIKKLEQHRKQFVQEYMTQRGKLGHSFTLEDCMEVAEDSAHKASIILQAKQLRQIIQELSYINESNQQLIQTSLSYIQYSIGLHVRKEPAIGYGPKSGKQYSNLLDAKV